jgi:8-oxo-dGTP diphosphatase
MQVVNARGDVLVDLLRVTEAELDSLEPLTHAVVVARSDGRTLLVFNRFKDRWELAGGLIDTGETPRACAVRELGEESGLVCGHDAPRFVGATMLRLQPDSRRPVTRVEYGALYFVEIEAGDGFVPNEEVSDVCWWDGVSPIDGLDAIDCLLAELGSEGQSR